jgi:RNA recognition motif-containing protein
MKLHIGNLSKAVTETELTDAITPFGAPQTVEIVRDQAGTSKGFAFAEFADDGHARAVITGLDGKEIGGQAVKIGEARPRKGGNNPAAARF